jgi:hypothetical protein
MLMTDKSKNNLFWDRYETFVPETHEFVCPLINVKITLNDNKCHLCKNETIQLTSEIIKKCPHKQ